MSFQAYPNKKCGFSISNHSIGTSRSAELRDNTISGAVGQFVKVPGLIEAVKVTLTEKKEEMTFVTISDEYGTANVTIFPLGFNMRVIQHVCDHLNGLLISQIRKCIVQNIVQYEDR